MSTQISLCPTAPNMPTLPKPIEIFYPGKQTASDGRKLSFPASQVAKWAATGQRVPLVPGHPKDDRPALGYATEFAFANGRLKVLAVEDLDPAFEAVVNSGQLNRVSVKLRSVGKDDWELAHIGFLGTSAPSLGDLAPAEFSNSEVIILAEDTDLEFAQRELDLAEREAAFEAERAAFAAQQKWSPVAAKLAAEGKILPIEEVPLVACFARLDAGETIEFSRDGKDETANPAEFLKTMLERAKPVVPFGEFANGGGKGSQSAEPAFFMKGGKGAVDDEDAEMHDAIVAGGVNVKDPVAYAAAVKKYIKEQG